MQDHDIDIRVIHVSRTFADIAAIPFEDGDVLDGTQIQKLRNRVAQHFGDMEYEVVAPQLVSHGAGKLRFPQFEIMVGVFERPKVLVFYVDRLPSDLEGLVLQELRKRTNSTTR